MILLEHERAFFQQLAVVVFSNPFDIDERAVDHLFATGEHRGSTGQGQHQFTRITPLVESALTGLADRGIEQLSDVDSGDRDHLRHAFLFQTYQRFLPQLDRLIRDQLESQEVSLDVRFADELVASLEKRGFSKEVGTHYLALFYQLRRAYYFIDVALVGAAPSMRQLRRALWNNVFTCDSHLYEASMWARMEDFSTLVLGETGSGKGSAAAAIGRSGFIPFDPKTRRFAVSFTQTYISANLSQFPEGLVESALFGHRKGAFTGAIDDHQGLMERCSAHGALFLDEIGDVTQAVQLKLLEVLQERTFHRVGDYKNRRFRGRVIAATNRSLRTLRAGKQFRDDFYYRLCSDVIEVPSLRQRLDESEDELPLLVDSLVTRIMGGRLEALNGLVFDSLEKFLPTSYPWPGNVRELEQAVRRIILSRKYEGDSHLSEPSDDMLLATQLRSGALTAKDLLARYCLHLYRQHGTYEEVAKVTALDRRTVKKHILDAQT